MFFRQINAGSNELDHFGIMLYSYLSAIFERISVVQYHLVFGK